MAKQVIDIGTVVNDGTGDPLRTAFDKANDNFTELYDGKSDTGHAHTLSDITDSGTAAASATGDFATAAQGTTADSALQNVVEDTSPQLGGNLDVNGNSITSAGAMPVTIGTGAGEDFAINTDVFVVEGDNEQVGIGTSPAAKLHVDGGIIAGDQTNATFGSGYSILRPNDGQHRTFAIVEGDTELRIGGGAWSTINFWTTSSFTDNPGMVFSGTSQLGIGLGSKLPDTRLDVNGAITQHPLSADPPDPDVGNYVVWCSDGVGSGDPGDILFKINVGSVVKIGTLIDYSALS